MTLEFILLNVNMGLGLIDENLEGLMDYFREVPLNFNMVGLAKSVALCIAFGMASYETYMMMLGKRGMDVMKILRMVILSLCISFSGTIAAALEEPGETLMAEAREIHQQKYQEVLVKEKEAVKLQDRYVKKLKTAVDSVRAAERRQELTDWDAIDIVSAGITKINEIALGELNALAKKGAESTEAFICEWIGFLIRFIGEVVFQMTYYALLVAQRIILFLMGLFLPLAFALSLAPPYKSAWSQFISKFLSITLWGFVIYVMMFFVDHILWYFIDLDCQAYNKLLEQNVSGQWDDVATLGIQGIGATCMYVVAMLIGAKVLSMAPEVAGWLIPGGVSSSAGNVAGGMAMGAVAGAAGAAAGTAAVVGGGLIGTGTAIVGGTAAAKNASQHGAGVGSAIAHGIFSQTSFGKAADQGHKASNTFGKWGKNDKK